MEHLPRSIRWCVVIMWVCCVRAQAECTDDAHCDSASFCNASYICVPCITCSDHGRLKNPDNPTHEVSCIKTLMNCGECMPGYSSENRSQKCDDIIAQQDAEWTVIVISVLSVLGVVMFIVVGFILYRRRGTLCKRILYDLDPPPPYTSSPPHPGSRVASVPVPERDHAWVSPSAPRSDDELEDTPINKVYGYSPEPASRTRENEGRQNVHLVNPPNYVRLPPGHDISEIQSSYLQPNGTTTDNVVNNNQINGYTVTPPDTEVVQPRDRNNDNVVVPANTSSDVVLAVSGETRFEIPDEEIPFVGRDSANRDPNNSTEDGSTGHQIIINNNYYNFIK